jgi:hypothetical protein
MKLITVKNSRKAKTERQDKAKMSVDTMRKISVRKENSELSLKNINTIINQSRKK